VMIARVVSWDGAKVVYGHWLLHLENRHLFSPLSPLLVLVGCEGSQKEMRSSIHVQAW
jgi:hypothetical protein